MGYSAPCKVHCVQFKEHTVIIYIVQCIVETESLAEVLKGITHTQVEFFEEKFKQCYSKTLFL